MRGAMHVALYKMLDTRLRQRNKGSLGAGKESGRAKTDKEKNQVQSDGTIHDGLISQIFLLSRRS